MNLAGLVTGHAAPSNAVHDGTRWTTWGELRGRAGAMATDLAKLGVQPGDRVAIVWPTSVEFVAAYLGVLALGAVAAPLNPQSPPTELVVELARIRPSTVLVAPGMEHDLGQEYAARVGGPAPSFLDVVPEAGGSAVLPVVERAGGDPAVVLLTSGTAGAPRPAVLTHGNLRSNLEQMLALPGEIARPDDVGLTAIPLFHIFGLNVALGLTLATGAALVLEQRFDPAASLALVSRLEVTSVIGVPAMYSAWADMADGQMRSVRLAVSGATALPASVAEHFEANTGVPLWQGYGLTEASPAVATALGTGRNRPGSVGRPLPGVEVRLVDESGGDVLEGDPGEIWVRGPNVFGGYLDDAAATADVLTGDGWLRTGDVGVLGEEGDLFVVDRRKDVIIVSGFNVYPGEVEDVVRAVPGVADVVALGRPDPQSGETVEVAVVRSPGTTSGDLGTDVTEERVRQAALASLARYKCPTSVRFVDELPRGLVGKALRRAVRQQLED